MKKKILSILFLLILFVSITGCVVTNGDGNIYDIEYYVDGVLIDHEPSEYVSGEVTPLVPLDDTGFVGWYESSDFTGSKVTQIKKTATGDKTFYAKIESTLNKTYRILYKLNGGALPLDAAETYVSGTGLEELPTPVKPNYEFLGWTLNGEFITSIDESVSGNITLVANWKKEEVVVNSLKDALDNMTNYSFTYSYQSKDLTNSEIIYYDYDGTTLKVSYIYDDYSYIVYFTEKDNVGYVYIPDYNDNYSVISEDDEDYENYLYSYLILDLSAINSSLFEVVNGEYVLKDMTKVHEVTSLIIGEYEDDTYKTLKLIVNENYLTKIEATSEYKSSDETMEYTYKVEFSNFGKVKITLPEISDTPSTITIEEALNSADNTVVYTKGYICGVVGNNVYIEDHTGGIYVYCGQSSLLGSYASLGKGITVKGTKTTYSGLVELTNITSLEYTNDEIELTPVTLTSVSENNLNKYISNLVNLTVSISSLPSSYQLEGKDNSFKISDGTNETTVFISKYVSSNKKTEIFTILKSLTIGETINITNGVVSCHNTCQIVITEYTTISKGKVEESGIKTNLTSIKVKPNTSFNDAIKNLEVLLCYSNNTTTKINNDNCEFIHEYNPLVETTYEVTVKYESFTTKFNIVVSLEESKPFEAPSDTKVLEDVIKELGYDKDTDTLYGINRGLPSTGNPSILVIPVDFTDYLAPTNMAKNIETAFFGTSAETGWESLASYYKKASYGALNITGTVLPVFSTGKKSTYYDSIEDGDYEILKAALTYYDATIDYSKYDSDGDGYIDAIYLVYSCEINREDDNSMWWAYTSEYVTDDYEYYDSVEADFYLLAGYDFLDETFASGYNPTYNLETFIHETGHLLGLDDYYDTDTSTGPDGGVGGGDMMDYNVGDHNAFSKAILGWVTPLIMGEDSATITLKSFGSSGDCLIIPKNWNGTYFDEYYIVDFYTPDGLNEKEAGSSGLFSTKGIRIYHIDSTLKEAEDAWYIWDIYQYNNSSTNHKLISLVEADSGNDIENENEYSANSDLFQVNDVFKNVKWYDGSNANFELKVVSMNDKEAVITVTIK